MDTTKWRRQPPAETLSDARIDFIRAQPMFFADDQLTAFWERKSQVSNDGFATGILA